MSTETKTSFAPIAWVGFFLLTLGVMSLIFFMLVEDEPGGVSLLLIAVGSSVLIYQRVQQRLRKTELKQTNK